MRTASLHEVKTFGVPMSCLAVSSKRIAKVSWAIMSLACGATMVAPMITPFLSEMSFTKPVLSSVMLLRAVRVSGATAVRMCLPRRLHSSSVSPV